MRFIREGRSALPDARWSELVGPLTLIQAEQYVSDPPPELGDPGTITMERNVDGLYVIYALEDAA